MHDRHVVFNTFVKALILLGVFIALTYIESATPLVRPQSFIAFIVVLAFVVSDAFLFSFFALVAVWWEKYVSFFQIEYIVLVLMAVVVFLLMRFIIFRRTFSICALVIGALCALWWVSLEFWDSVFSLPFLLEVLYTVVAGALLFLTTLWTRNESV